MKLSDVGEQQLPQRVLSHVAPEINIYKFILRHIISRCFLHVESTSEYFLPVHLQRYIVLPHLENCAMWLDTILESRQILAAGKRSITPHT